jgi:hypothetical protein
MANKLPAQLCYETNNLGSGGAFDPSKCYCVSLRANPARPVDIVFGASTLSAIAPACRRPTMLVGVQPIKPESTQTFTGG